MITTINEFKKMNENTVPQENTVLESNDMGVTAIEFTVRYEKMWDGEYDNFTEHFDNIDQAVKFAKDNNATVDYKKTVDGKTTEQGFVNTATKEMVKHEKTKWF